MRTAPLAAEFLLAAACCRPPGPARDGAVQAASRGVDWRRFAATAARHRIEGLAWSALAAAGAAPEPPALADLRRAAHEIAAESVANAAESARLQAALDAAGIANLVLKGATMDVLAWGRLGLKRSWDIDLLVAPDAVGGARALLEREGYAMALPARMAAPGAFETWVAHAKEAVFRHPAHGRLVELHWRATDVATLLPRLSARSPSQTVAISPGRSLRTFADEPLFAYLCVHGASHAWSRLKWLADLGAFLARRDTAERARLFRRAADLEAGRCPALALLLCERLLGLPIPDDVADAVRADGRTARLATISLDALTGGGGAEIADRAGAAERILLSHFLFADGWRFRLAEWRRQWVSVDDRMRLPLPRPLHFVYGLLRGPLFVRRRLERAFRRP